MLGGSVDVAAGSVSDAVLLASQGRHVRCFLILYTRPLVAVAVAPTMKERIKTIHDLKGHTVGVSAPGSASHQFLNFLLVTNNISPADVNIVSVGMSASSVAALEHGKVDAAVLIASAITNFEDRNPGNSFLVDTRTPEGAKRIFGSEVFPSLGLMAEDHWLQQNPDVARRLVRAVKKGLRWVRENPAEKVREALPEDARMATAESDFRAIRDTQKVASPDGLMPDGAPEVVIRFATISDEKVRAAHVNASEIYTNQFADER
jgi:NitT/TauT family transport system substrate-binding protein